MSKTQVPELSIFSFLLPQPSHDLIGNVPRWLRPERAHGTPPQRRSEHTAGYEPSLLRAITSEITGHKPGNRLIPVAHQDVFAVPHELDVRAQLGLQIADTNDLHDEHCANLTMLAMSIGCVIDA